MKIFFTISFSLLLFQLCVAQQAPKSDDAILLDYYQSQRYLDAANYLKKTYPEPVSDVKILSKLAYTSQMANQLPEAQAYYQRIYDIDSTNTGALFSIGNINLRRGNQPKAEIYLKKILLKDTTNMSVYTKLATIAADKKDTIAAVKYLQSANRLNPGDVDVAVDLSAFYIAQKQFDVALKTLNKAAEGDPDNVYIVGAMAGLLYKEKKWAETVKACNRLIAMEAADGQVYYKLGVSYMNLKNYACGAESFASMDSRDETEYSCYFSAMCYKGLKDYNSAINMMNKAIAQGVSANVSAYYGEIADNNEKMNRNKTAVSAYQKGLQFKEDPAIYMALAELYQKQLKDAASAKKYYKLAVAAYQKSLGYNDTPLTYYSVASLYDSQLKDTANAVKYYKKYLDSKPPQKVQQQYILFTQDRINRLQNKN